MANSKQNRLSNERDHRDSRKYPDTDFMGNALDDDSKQSKMKDAKSSSYKAASDAKKQFSGKLAR